MPIAEIFISAFVTVLFEKLVSGNLLSFARQEGVLKEINKWSVMLRKINFVLRDAEDQQGNNQAAKIWLEELQDLAYDLDDVLDEFATEQLKLKLDGLIPNIQPRSVKSKVKAILPSCTTSSSFMSPRGFMFHSNMKSKIKEISTRLESITTHTIDLNLNNTIKTSPSKPTSQRTPTISKIDGPKVCGRGRDIKEIRQLLLEHGETSQGNDEIGVIPIVGMGGIGKTTLAQAVYNDELVEKKFQKHKAWVCVSDDFDVMRITKTILEYVTSKKCDFDNLNQVQVELKKCLASKKFLIVLDDVWQKDHHEWNVLKSPFCDAARGSKVIVTTRDENVASLLGSSNIQPHIVRFLPFDDCWSLFSQHAFGNRNTRENTNLVEIGKKIVEKCKGLPLSARVLGSLLRCKESEVEWKVVLDSEWWEDNQIPPSLRLSYHHLPPYLKPCFAYCSIFPKDYAFGKDELVLLWIAEGLVQQGRENRQLENIGSDYFHELFSRSLFQLSSTDGNTKLFMMHDMINDLAVEISGDLCYRSEDKPSDEERSRNLGRARYSSYCQGEFDDVNKFKRFFEAKCLRTFLPFSLRNDDCYLARIVPSTLFPKLKYLRALSLRNYRVIDLPDSIGNMIHLRYFDVSYTCIKTLPDWVLKLYNIQTLILEGCISLKKLPKNMGNLIKLRYFNLADAYRIKKMPLGIGNMKSLHMLSNFIVTKDNGSRIRELGELRHIGETLCISGLHYVIDPNDANGACLLEKKNLTKLMMLYYAKSDELLKKGVQEEVLRMLQPHNNLKELHIRGYQGTSFPTWLKDPLFTNMVHIQIEDCSNCSVLPSFGQLKSLKKLYIKRMSSVRHVGPEFYGPLSQKPFPSLETLSFDNMPEWEDWFAFGVEDEVQPFGHVKNLTIKCCSNLLGKLPTYLPSLEVLKIKKCEKLVVKLGGLVYPSLASLYVNGVELPFTPPRINNVKNTHESSSLSSPIIENISVPNSMFHMNKLFQNLNSLEIVGISKLVYLPGWLTRLLTSLKTLKIRFCLELETLLDNSHSEVLELEHQFPVLEQLEISGCRELVSLFSEELDGESKNQRGNGVVQSFMKSLKRLDIWSCDKLEKLPQGLYMFTCLVELFICECPNLVSFPGTESPPALMKLSLKNCRALERLERMCMLTCLVELDIGPCLNLVSFPETGLPPTLVKLSIRDCKALQSPLPCWNSDHNLETIYVYNCPSLTRFVSSSNSNDNDSTRAGGLPSSLKHLSIIYCQKLEALFAGEEDSRIHCPSLEEFTIDSCSRFIYLPDTQSDDSLGKLKELTLNTLGDLPDGWVRAITNLRRIRLETERSVSSYILKETGFLANLDTLHLSNVTVAVNPSKWGLHRMSSLRELRLNGPIRVAREGQLGEGEEVKVCVFPLDGMLLPTSLTILAISLFPDLERLYKGFECLTSLQRLYLKHCPRLAYFPEDGLPDTLLSLEIWNCPLLNKCNIKGRSRIPFVDVGKPVV